MYINENVVTFKIYRFHYPYRFQYQSEIISVIQLSIVYSCNIFPVIDPNEHINTI